MTGERIPESIRDDWGLPADIPEAIAEAAINLACEWGHDDRQVAAATAIARALLAERERCARIAEGFNTEWPNDAHGIAGMIRA